MNELNRLSVIVPTYNRQVYIERQIRYWRESSIKLYILDGSENSLPHSKIKNLPDNIKYYHMPCSLVERLKKGAELVVTPYVMLLGDDEFYIPSAIVQCVNELDRDAELVSCMGLAAQFWHGPKNKVLGRDSYQRLKNYRVIQEGVVERMVYHMNPYICSTIYSVMRSQVWQENIELMVQCSYSSPVINEIQFELGTCFQGKSKVINVLMWLRSGENPPISLNGWDRKIDFLTWYKFPQYADEREEFLSKFVSHFSKDRVDTVSRRDVEAALLQLNNYLLQRKKTGNIKQYFFEILSSLKSILAGISPQLISIFRKIANNVHYYVFDDKELKRYAAEMNLRVDCSVDVEAVEEIEKAICDFRLGT